MNFIIDKSIVELGIKSVVIGIAKNIDPQAPLSDSFLTKQKKMQDWAVQCDIEASGYAGICGFAAKRGAQYQKISAYRPGLYPEYSAPRFYAAHQQRYRYL